MTFILPTEDTIAAIATAVRAGQGGIAIIRISGIAAIEVGQSVVSIPGQNKWESHTVLYGHAVDSLTKEIIERITFWSSKKFCPNRFFGRIELMVIQLLSFVGLGG